MMNLAKRIRNSVLVPCVLIFCAAAPLAASGQAPLPKAEKVLSEYARAAGGKKRLARVSASGSTFRSIEGAGPASLVLLIARPGMLRMDVVRGGTRETIATNGTAGWRESDGIVSTLTDESSKALRLAGQLFATRFSDTTKQRIRVQTLRRETLERGDTYVVSFTSRDRANVLVHFDARTYLPVKVDVPDLTLSLCFADHIAAAQGIAEPRKATWDCGKPSAVEFAFAEPAAVSGGFDPPGLDRSIDVDALLKELLVKEEKMLQRLNEYSYTQKETERYFDGRGAVKKETTRVYEVFPTRSGKRVLKLLSENGVELTGEKREKEAAEAASKIAEAEAKYEEDKAREERRKLERGEDSAPTESALERQAVLSILRISEIYASRVETFRGRPSIVLNFRPRPGFKPRGFVESVFSKLAGTVWIDSEEKQIIRVESRVVEDVKFGGGLLATFRKGSAIVFERLKFGEVWLPRLFQSNASAKFLLVGGFDASGDVEYSDYRRYQSEVKEYKIGEQQP